MRKFSVVSIMEWKLDIYGQEHGNTLEETIESIYIDGNWENIRDSFPEAENMIRKMKKLKLGEEIVAGLFTDIFYQKISRTK